MTGDTHGNWMNRLRTGSFPEQKEMTKSDYVIVCGDFGIWDGANAEKHNLDWLEGKPFTTLFVSGNHDNYDILDALPITKWCGGKVNFIRPTVIHLMRGQVYNIDGNRFFTFGGASSHDTMDGILDKGDPKIKIWRRDDSKMFRINHVSWWERELPSETEMKEGMENLKIAANEVDYIITHSPYTSLLKQLDEGIGLYHADKLTDYLQGIKEIVSYKHWFFGHMHVNQTFPREHSSCLYEQIVRMV